MLLRRIKSIGCWNPQTYKDKINREDYSTPGDTLSDLKTDNNGLSVWFTPDLDETNIKPLLAAMAVGRDSIQKMTYVVLDENRLLSMGIEKKPVLGLAPGISDEAILKSHYDLTDIDYKRIGPLANYIEELIEGNHAKTVNEKDLEKYINELIDNDKICTEDLKDGIKNRINRSKSA